jgi:phosphate transport system ATP-binding protein
MALLKTINLKAGFGENEVLHGISLELPKSAILALIGPSGCGKSTFLRTLNRMHLETPGAWVSGEIFLEDLAILDSATNPVKVRRKVGMVFQKPNPFPGMSIFENTVAGVRLGSDSILKADLQNLAEQTLTRAGLWKDVKDKLHHPGASLSGGQQQRLCIARALAVNPQVILMDEPTSALDPISTGVIEDLLIELRETVTILIVTHNMQQARRISDVTGFFLSGELIEIDTTDSVFTNPKQNKTELYITGRFG